jgi:hypothetical protein
MKVSDLEGIWLDYWVAKAQGHHLSCDWNQDDYILIGTGAGDLRQFSPSTAWIQGGEIIEEERLCITALNSGIWKGIANNASTAPGIVQFGQTPLVAAMRAYVASKCGEEVPDE